MTSKRITTTVTRCIAVSLLSRAVIRHQPSSSTTVACRLYPVLLGQISWGTMRHHSRPAFDGNPIVYEFKDIKLLSENPSLNRILIDAREPGEFRTGAIPTAINLPIVSAPEALSLPADEFEDRFGFAKPAKDKELVFYCKAGVRSSAAAQLALQNGYGKVGEYRGSWLDWEKKKKGDMKRDV